MLQRRLKKTIRGSLRSCPPRLINRSFRLKFWERVLLPQSSTQLYCSTEEQQLTAQLATVFQTANLQPQSSITKTKGLPAKNQTKDQKLPRIYKSLLKKQVQYKEKPYQIQLDQSLFELSFYDQLNDCKKFIKFKKEVEPESVLDLLTQFDQMSGCRKRRIHLMKRRLGFLQKETQGPKRKVQLDKKQLAEVFEQGEYVDQMGAIHRRLLCRDLQTNYNLQLDKESPWR